jgi:mannose-1-phosphate guanylyltransferase
MQKAFRKKTTKRPWGRFEELCKNEKCTVKILSVRPNQELSLQRHRKRSEFWKVLSGEGLAVVGNARKKAAEGKEFRVRRGEKHRLIASGKGLKVLEISSGRFDEGDEERLEDRYGRQGRK